MDLSGLSKEVSAKVKKTKTIGKQKNFQQVETLNYTNVTLPNQMSDKESVHDINHFIYAFSAILNHYYWLYNRFWLFKYNCLVLLFVDKLLDFKYYT